MHTRIRYGDEEFDLVLPRGELAAWLEPSFPVPPAPPAQVVQQALEAPIDSPRLRELARGKRSAAIMVSGKDRVAGADVYLPPLLSELNAAGIPDGQIEIVLATGTHAKHSPADAAAVFGAEAVRRIRWREHDCNDAGRFRRVGATSFGTEVLLDRGVLDAGMKVLTGSIVPHYFAGFGGGRKALVPGVAAVSTIDHNHRLTLDPRGGIRPGIRPCSLDENPVHLDMLEAARMVSPVFLLNTIVDTGRRVVRAFAGGLEAAHRAGCSEAARIFRLRASAPFDAAVACAGGAPYDCNFTQALKAVFDVQEIVRPGGAILWIAECPDGIKRQFVDWGHVEPDAELERVVRSSPDHRGHNSLMLRALTQRVSVALWSGLAEPDVRAVGAEPVHSLREGLDWLASRFAGGFRCAVVPFANITYASLG